MEVGVGRKPVSTVQRARLDIASEAYTQDPYRHYRELRRLGPAHELAGQPDDWILVTRYELGRAVLADRRFSKQLPDRYMANSTSGGRGPSLLGSDPPEHTRLRDAVGDTFCPRNIHRLRPRIEAISQDLIDKINARRAAGDTTFELRHAYALPLAFTVLGELVGVPLAKQSEFHRWTTVMLSPVTPECDRDAHARAVTAIREYVYGRVRELQQSPMDPDDPRADALIPALAQADPATALDEDEIVTMTTLMLAAGYEGAANLILNGMAAFLTHLDQWDLLVSSPELVDSAVREVLRYDCPVQRATLRIVTEDLELAGVRFGKGTLVGVSLASANHDERRFDHAERFDITRPPTPNLAFGHGLHHCLGANLASQEGAVAFRHLAGQLPNLRLAPGGDAIRWARTGFLRGPAHLTLTWR
jgi:cytochrome P450